MEMDNRQAQRIKWSEADLSDTAEVLKRIHAAGIGANDVKTVIRDICLTDKDLANTILEELQYWSKHGSNSEGKVQDLCYSL